jgi:hypothetical protein
MRDVLDPFREDIERAAAGEPDVVDQGILLWRLIHHVIAGYRERNPSWLFFRHEDLSLEPVPGFRDMYDRLGLEFNDEVRDRITRHTDPRNPVEDDGPARIRRHSRAAIWTWQRRLSPQEIERIRRLTEDLWPAFYSEREWDAPVEALSE